MADSTSGSYDSGSGSGSYDNVVDLLAAMQARNARVNGDTNGGPRQGPSRRHPFRTEPAIFRVLLELDDTDVFRKLDIRSDVRLDALSDLIQLAMGWENSHLHLFAKGPSLHDEGSEKYLMQFSIDEGDMDGIAEELVRIDEVLAEPGDTLFYWYDFGDDWEHTLTVLEVLPLPADAPVAVCIDGSLASPPENSGHSGYQQLIRAYSGTPRPEDAELLAWAGSWDPTAFSVDEVNDHFRRWTALPNGLKSLIDPMFGVPAPVGEFLSRFHDGGVQHFFMELARAANLAEELAINPAVAAEMLRPYQWFLDRTIPNGLTLTSSGYLKPADVLTCLNELQLRWRQRGGRIRETLCPPVYDVRESAQKLGLIRKLHGQLVPTVAGAKLSGDPLALWKHLARKVPMGTGAAQDAGRIVLLLMTAGIDPTRSEIHGPMVALGWGYSAAEPIQEWDAYELAQPTILLMEALGALHDLRLGPAGDNKVGGVAFARAALRT